MKAMARYWNGNVFVRIYRDGTKIRQFEGAPAPVLPESLDVKISNFCDAGCAYCHELSTTRGTHGDLVVGLDILSRLPRGAEVAIGGGNPLAHPDLIPFLTGLRAAGVIPNLTVNERHLVPFRALIDHLRSERLIYGLGISYQGETDALWGMVDRDTVFHLIVGVHTPDDLRTIIAHVPNAKVLLLGYKQIGRGKTYYNPAVQAGIDEWCSQIGTFLESGCLLSFDNLGLAQLDMRRLFSAEWWNARYMGDDGVFTMYLDLVRSEYAMSSTSEKQAIDGMDLAQMFAQVRANRPDKAAARPAVA